MPAAKGSRRVTRSGNAARSLFDKLRRLPKGKRAAVEEFVDLLGSSGSDLSLARAASRLSEGSFQGVWENPDDAAYDKL